MKKRTNNYLILILLVSFFITSCNKKDKQSDELLKNLITDYPAIDSNGYMHVVVEIPTGTTQKWEVNKKDGTLQWELKNGKPRIVNYIGYPANYGMVPRTILSKTEGGDGDPIDVLILGDPITRGEIVKTQIIGILLMKDNNEQDDKLISVKVDSQFSHIKSIQDLNTHFPGITSILTIWFSNYKGSGQIQVNGFSEKAEALLVLKKAMQAYNNYSND